MKVCFEPCKTDLFLISGSQYFWYIITVAISGLVCFLVLLASGAKWSGMYPVTL